MMSAKPRIHSMRGVWVPSGSSLHFKETGVTHEAPLLGTICPALPRPMPHILSWYPEWACLSLPSPGVVLILALQVSQASILTASAAKLFF